MPRSFASLISWFTAFVVLVFAAWSAIEGVRFGWVAQGITHAVVPLLWVLLCSAVLANISKRVRDDASRVAGRAFLLSLMPVGAILGFALGAFSGLGASYGNGDAELAKNFVIAFALGAAIALVPSSIISAIAFASAEKPPSDTSPPTS
jgi:hypothetical protein